MADATERDNGGIPAGWLVRGGAYTFGSARGVAKKDYEGVIPVESTKDNDWSLNGYNWNKTGLFRRFCNSDQIVWQLRQALHSALPGRTTGLSRRVPYVIPFPRPRSGKASKPEVGEAFPGAGELIVLTRGAKTFAFESERPNR